MRTLTYKELLASVRREVEELLNTRCSFHTYELLDRPRSTIDYGIPDLYELNPTAREDQKQIARQITAAIKAYEPRLRDIYVDVEGYDQGGGILHLSLSAILRLERVSEPISFPLAVSASGIR